VPRPAHGALPPKERKVTLPLDPDFEETLRATGSDGEARANAALRAAFAKT